MIVVVEGISAAGKTSWCRKHAPGQIVEESPQPADVPDRIADPERWTAYWIDRNALRWRRAGELDARAGLAVCDSDPLKLHYNFGLWRLGLLAPEHWRLARDLTRRAIAAGRLGFADLFLVKRIGLAQARAQRDADATRSRRHFELHARLGPPLEQWYRAIDLLLPGRVVWTLPEGGVPDAEPRRAKDDLGLFDALMQALSPLDQLDKDATRG
jgi:hypothetical protein